MPRRMTLVQSISMLLCLALSSGCGAEASQWPSEQGVAPSRWNGAEKPQSAALRRVARLRPSADDALRSLGAPGVSVALDHDLGQSLTVSGYADKQAGVSMRPDHLMPIGGASELFIAAVVLALADDGVLSLSDPVSRWLPWFPDRLSMPLYRLLNHTSGIADIREISTSHDATDPVKLAEAAAALGLRFTPGTRFERSATNFLLVGLVLEAATGEPWHVTLRRRILERHGLAHTFVAGREVVLGEIARGDARSALQAPGPDVYRLVSSAADLARFARLLHRGSIISFARRHEMRGLAIALGAAHARRYAPDAASVTASHGLGIVSVVADDELTFVLAASSERGYQTTLIYRPDGEISVAVLANSARARGIEVGRSLVATVGSAGR